MRMAADELPLADLQAQRPSLKFVDVNADSQSIIVNAPVARVYLRCLSFEEFPQFLTSITKINRINETGFACASIIDGQEVKSFVFIIMRVPERRIAWQAVSDPFRIGVVLFDPLPDGSTKVTIKVRSIIEPVKLTEAVGRYLRNFKRFLEEGPTA
jgi:uncharacterized membrane protein